MPEPIQPAQSAQSAQPAQPPAYEGQPVPTPQVNIVQTAIGPQGPMVVITMKGPNGMWVAFMPPAEAEGFAGRLQQAAVHARSGLEVASSLAQVRRAGSGGIR